MTITLRGTPVSDFAFGTSTTVTKQSGLQNGDWLIWQVDNGVFNAGATTVGINTPSGWTLVDTINVDNNGTSRHTCHAVFKRKVDGNEGASFTATGTTSAGTTGMASIMSAYVGADPTDCIDTYSKSSGDSTGTTITATGITVTGSGGMLVACHVDWETDRGPLTGMTQIVGGAANGCSLDNLASSPGPTGNLTCSCSATEQWTVFLISLKADTASGGAASGGAIASDKSILMPTSQLLC